MTHEKRRYSAEDLEQIADGLDVHYGNVSEISLALRQAASTEAQVMGLVEALSDIGALYEDATIAQVKAIAGEALSKFRGES